MRRLGMTVYLALAIVICLVPLGGLLWYKGGESSENRKLSEFPTLSQKKDGTRNSCLRPGIGLRSISLIARRW